MLTRVPDNERQAVRVLGDAQERDAQHRDCQPVRHSRQAVLRALLLMDGKIEATLRRDGAVKPDRNRKDQCRARGPYRAVDPLPDRCDHLCIGEAWRTGLVRARWRLRHVPEVHRVYRTALGLCDRVRHQDRKTADPTKMAEELFYKSEGDGMISTRVSETIHEGWAGAEPPGLPPRRWIPGFISLLQSVFWLFWQQSRLSSPRRVSAAGDIKGRVIGCNATPAQVEKINELWDKNISIGEYDEQICPQYLVDMPPDLKEILYKKQYQWGSGPGPSNTTIENPSPEAMNVTQVPGL